MTWIRRPVRWRQLLRLSVTALVTVLVTGLFAALAVLVTAAPAAAHAELIESDPADGAILPEAPSEVTLTFNEPVRLTAQKITVYDAEGRVVDSEATASGVTVTVAVPGGPDLGRGTYVVGWYVVSADGHPISGSLRFSVGEPSIEVAAPPPPPESPRTVTVAQGVLQATTYLGLFVAAGLTVFGVLVLPREYAGERVRWRLRRVVRVGALVAAAAGLLQVPVASAYAQGGDLSDALAIFDAGLVTSEVISAVLLLLGLAGLALLASDRPPEPGRRLVLLAAAALAVASPAVVGHTRAYEPEPLLLVTDVLHLVAGSVWLGGLVGLALTLRPLAGRERLAAATLARFSTIAAGLLLAVAVTGSVLAWRILGSWSGFVDTRYGILLLVKIGIAGVVAGVAAWNRFRLLPRVRAAAGFADRGRAASLVARSVAAEALLLAGLLGVTGFLVNQSPRPAAVEVPPGRTGVQDGELEELRVLALMSPRERGPNTVLVQIQDAAGEPVEPPRAPEVQVRSADLDLGSVPVRHTDAGTYRADVLIPSAGEWEVQVSLRQSKFESPVTTVRFDVADVR